MRRAIVRVLPCAVAGAVLALSLSASGVLAQLPESAAGASVFVIDSAEIAASNARSLSELLAARVPGVSVMRSGGSAGEGADVRMRGVHSFVMPAAPVLVIDGVRVAARQTVGVIGAPVEWSEIDELLPEDIARVEVLRGPAAAAQYGPGANDGVIVVTTKGGAPGPFALRARTDAGLSVEDASWPANYRLTGVWASNGQPMPSCVLVTVAEGYCRPTSFQHFNPLEQTSPFRTGRTAAEHLSASGGNGGTAGYVGLTGQRRDGVLAEDELQRWGARAHVSQRLRGQLILEGSAGALRDDATMGNLARSLDAGLFGLSQPGITRGYRLGAVAARPPQTRGVERAMASLGLRWHPVPWLQASVIGGADRTNVREAQAFFTNLAGRGATHLGTRHDDVRSFAANVAATYHVDSSIVSHTMIRYDRFAYRTRWLDSLGYNGGMEMTSERLNLPVSGVSIAEQLAWRARITVDGALWRGGPASYGGARRRDVYPSTSIAWSAVKRGATELRLRAAYGEAAGADPDSPVALGGMPDSVYPAHAAARSERTREREVGADLRLGGRLDVAVTTFRSSSTNLMFLAPSASATGSSPEGFGAMRNAGTEWLVHAAPLRRGALRWDLTWSIATLENRITSIANVAPVYRPSTFLLSGYFVGQPVGALWALPYTYADANGDHIIDTSEVHVGTRRLYDQSMPRLESALRSSLGLPHGIAASVTLDYRGRYQLADVNEQARCLLRICRGMLDSSAPLAEQAAAVTLYEGPVNLSSGYIEDASFLRLRELAVGWSLPSLWTRFTGRDTRVSVVGRDLATFTRYRGVDPEITGGAPDELPRYDHGKLPILPTVLLRVDLGGIDGN